MTKSHLGCNNDGTKRDRRQAGKGASGCGAVPSNFWFLTESRGIMAVPFSLPGTASPGKYGGEGDCLPCHAMFLQHMKSSFPKFP